MNLPSEEQNLLFSLKKIIDDLFKIIIKKVGFLYVLLSICLSSFENCLFLFFLALEPSFL